MSPPGTAEPALAATVVLMRPGPTGPEVLLIQRPLSMAFGPGIHVFPGGRVDPDDAVARVDEAEAAARALAHNLPPESAVAVHRAAIREVREETGIGLGGIDALAAIAHWTTPRFMPRRFSTWFFVADLPTNAILRFESDEVADTMWATPARALDALAAGEISMWVPTTSVLERLIEIRATRAADVAARIHLAPVPSPRVVSEDATEVRFAFGGVGGLPGRIGEARLLGRQQLVLVDPGDPSDAALELIDSAVERRHGALAAIVLSQTDPDHAAAAEAVAIPLEIPVMRAPGAGRHLPYATSGLADGDALPSDVPARVRLDSSTPGRLEIELG